MLPQAAMTSGLQRCTHFELHTCFSFVFKLIFHQPTLTYVTSLIYQTLCRYLKYLDYYLECAFINKSTKWLTGLYYPHVRCESSIISHGRKSHSLSTRQPSTTQKLWVFSSLHGDGLRRHCSAIIYGLLCFQVVYKEVEKRPAVGADDLSLHNITMGTTLFSTQSKCMSVFI